MKILNLTAENVKKLKAVEITPAGAIVQVTGKNGAGKSSVLDTIAIALGGAKMIPKEPIRRGEKSARIKLDLGELIVTRKFSEGGATSLVVEGTNGARFNSPQRMLDELLGTIAFDPLAFSRMDAKAQFDMLRQVSKVDVDLEALAGKNKTDFETRTDVNRRAKQLRAQADGITVPADTPADPVDVEALLNELGAASDKNTELERRRIRREEAAREIEMNKAHVAHLQKEIERYNADCAVLEAKLSSTEPLPEPVDVTALRTAIDTGRKANDAIEKRRRKTELEADAAQLEKQAADLSDQIDARNAEKDKALAGAKMPIADITLGDGLVLYKGIPFDQASSAEQLRTSVAIAMAANPKLRVLRIKDGGLLDEDSMQILREMVEAADYQCWIETVHANGPVAIEMVDGAAKVEEAAAETADKPTSTPAAKEGEARADGSLL